MRALIPIHIEEESRRTLVPIASVIHDECIFPDVTGLYQRIFLILIGEVRNTCNLRVLSTATVNDQFRVLRLRRS